MPVKCDPIETIVENSYKDFHAKGLDYICLKRSPKQTWKVYFLDGDVTRVPEVVNPHNHRYPFYTLVLAGSMVDHRYHETYAEGFGQVFQRFDYRTPLNGGDGFTAVGENRLVRSSSEELGRNHSISRSPAEVHTIQMLSNQTILLLEQLEDVFPLDVPTQCWVRRGAPKPDTSGLYTKFTPDEITHRLRVLVGLTYYFHW